jgi:hypothetical protein
MSWKSTQPKAQISDLPIAKYLRTWVRGAGPCKWWTHAGDACSFRRTSGLTYSAVPTNDRLRLFGSIIWETMSQFDIARGRVWRRWLCTFRVLSLAIGG